MADANEQDLLALNQRLLESIANGDWNTYQELCDPSLTAFEPEAHGQLVEGLAFHEFYFKLGGFSSQHHTTMCAPKVRLIGDVALLTYVRLNQRVNSGQANTAAVAETRIWHKQAGRWKHIHFHRTPVGSSA